MNKKEITNEDKSMQRQALQLQALRVVSGHIYKLADQSSAIKICTALIFVGTLTMLSAKADEGVVTVFFFVAYAMMFLDGYFLYHERLFRSEYNSITEGASTMGKMDHTKMGAENYFKAVFSKTIIAFYLIQIFAASAMYLVSK